jgi:hypothetical protein
MRCFRSGLVVVALSCAVAPPGLAQSGEARSMASMQQLSAKLARSYLQTWSSNTRAALDQVPRLYASRTRFYGQLLDHRRLMREKAGAPLPHELYARVREELTGRYGGLTAFSRAPAEGLWQEAAKPSGTTSLGSRLWRTGSTATSGDPIAAISNIPSSKRRSWSEHRCSTSSEASRAGLMARTSYRARRVLWADCALGITVSIVGTGDKLCLPSPQRPTAISHFPSGQ